MRTRQLAVRLSDEEYAKLDAMAQRTQRTRPDVLRLLLRLAQETGALDIELKEGRTEDGGDKT